MPTATQAPPARSESAILEAFDTLTECPECQLGRYALNLFRVNGHIKVACNICEQSRDYEDAHTPPA